MVRKEGFIIVCSTRIAAYNKARYNKNPVRVQILRSPVAHPTNVGGVAEVSRFKAGRTIGPLIHLLPSIDKRSPCTEIGFFPLDLRVFGFITWDLQQ